MLKEKLIEEFNRLQIEGMAKVTSLNELKGDYINLTYHLPSGQAVKLLDGNKIYYANEPMLRASCRRTVFARLRIR